MDSSPFIAPDFKMLGLAAVTSFHESIGTVRSRRLTGGGVHLWSLLVSQRHLHRNLDCKLANEKSEIFDRALQT